MGKVVVFDIGNVVFFTRWEWTGQFLHQWRDSISAEKVTKIFWGGGWNGRCLEHFLNLNEGTDEQFHAIAEKELGVSIPEGVFWTMWNQQWESNQPVISIIEQISILSNPPMLAVCSNINQPHWTHLCTKYRIMDKFQCAALSYRVGRMKPHDAMFELVVSKFPLQHEFLFVDDRPDNLEAARKFGWDVHHYQEGSETVLRDKLQTFLQCQF